MRGVAGSRHVAAGGDGGHLGSGLRHLCRRPSSPAAAAPPPRARERRSPQRGAGAARDRHRQGNRRLRRRPPPQRAASPSGSAAARARSPRAPWSPREPAERHRRPGAASAFPAPRSACLLRRRLLENGIEVPAARPLAARRRGRGSRGGAAGRGPARAGSGAIIGSPATRGVSPPSSAGKPYDFFTARPHSSGDATPSEEPAMELPPIGSPAARRRKPAAPAARRGRRRARPPRPSRPPSSPRC